MGWVRFDDKAIDHPKFLALSASAFRLWFEGMSYCNRHLTDGVIAKAALRGFRYAKQPRIAELMETRLWENHPEGYQVHDYLQWNDDKATVESAKAKARERAAFSRSLGARALNVPSGVGSSGLEKEDGEERGQLAARFLERFQALYKHHRHGAFYHLKPNRDWLKVCELLGTYDSAHLEKLAAIILTTDDDWIARTDRGISILAARASWADDRLKAWEAQAS